MGSPHSGHDEILRVDTELLSFSIKGPACHPKLYSKDFSDTFSKVDITCLDKYALYIHGQNDILSIHPLFFEQQNYQIIIRYSPTLDLEFWHDNLGIREKVTDYIDNHSEFGLKTGVINFRGNIGYSDFVLYVNGKKYMTVTVEVFPVKIDYKNDYKSIVDDLTVEFYNMIFDYLRETYSGYKIGNKKSNSLVEFLEIIKHIFSEYIKALDIIIRQPHHVLQTRHEIVDAHKAKRVDNYSIRWIEKHSNMLSYNNNSLIVQRINGSFKENTFNTRENQLVKFILLSTIARLTEFKKNYIHMERVKYKGIDQKGVVDPINSMISVIGGKINSSFLKDVSDYTNHGQLSLVFSMAPGYRELYINYMMLIHGLSLSGDIFHMSLKDLADLYEYWCFVKLNSLLKKKYQLASKDIIRVNRNGIFLTMSKNQKSTVKYNCSNGDQILLSYNESGKYPTGPQKPDNTLSLCKRTKDGFNKFQYVFDAKYRMDPALKGSWYYEHISQIPGPEEEDINTMHRYRDAIVSAHEKKRPWERLTFGAYVLFPLSGSKELIAEYKNEHIFYKSIEEVNIGGLPFLPSSTELVEELLDKLINETTIEADLRPPYQSNIPGIAELIKALSAMSLEERKAVGHMLEVNVKDLSLMIETYNNPNNEAQ